MTRFRSFGAALGVAAAVGILLTALGAFAGADEDSWVHLIGDTSKETVRLAWEFEKWPETLEGVTIRRREVDPDGTPTGDWKTVTRNTLTPELSATGDLSPVEPRAEERKRLEEKRRDLIAKGTITPTTREENLRVLRKGEKSTLEIFRMVIMKDLDLAYMLGTALTDPNVPADKRFQYGLFPVFDPPKDTENPLASYTTIRIKQDDTRLKPRDLSVRALADEAFLTWKLSDQQVKNIGVRTYHVYRIPKGIESIKRLTEAPIHAGTSVLDSEKNRWHVWTYLDATVKADEEYTYAISPVHAFGNELPIRTRINFFEKDRATVSSPGITHAKLNPDRGGVVLGWEFPEAEEERISGFQVDVTPFPEGQPKTLTKTLSPTTREMVDKNERSPDQAVLYRVSALVAGGVESESESFFFLRVSDEAPPPPEGVKAEFLMMGKKPALHLTWKAKRADDKQTDGYAVYADHPEAGTLSRQLSFEVVRKEEAFLTLDMIDGRKIRIGVTAVSKRGRQSKKTEITAFMPGSIPAAPSNTKSRIGDNGELMIKWESATTPDLLGFRVYQGAELLADEGELKAGTREWTIEKPDPKLDYELSLRAVSRTGELSRMTNISATSTPDTGPRAPGPPWNLKAERVEANGKHYIRLNWDVDPSARKFQISTDEKEISVFGEPRAIALSKPGEVRLPVADPKRTLTIRLRALGAGDLAGLPSEIQVRGKDRPLPPSVLPEFFDLVDGDGGTWNVSWSWDYPKSDKLKGFRITMNGNVMADETKLGPDARSWSGGPVKRKTRYAFELHAVTNDGKVSEAGPKRTVIHFRR